MKRLLLLHGKYVLGLGDPRRYIKFDFSLNLNLEDMTTLYLL